MRGCLLLLALARGSQGALTASSEELSKARAASSSSPFFVHYYNANSWFCKENHPYFLEAEKIAQEKDFSVTFAQVSGGSEQQSQYVLYIGDHSFVYYGSATNPDQMLDFVVTVGTRVAQAKPTGSSVEMLHAKSKPEPKKAGCYVNEHKRQFLGRYPPSAERCNDSSGSCTFDEAKVYCDELKDCMGVTRDGNDNYSVRKGHEGLQNSGGDESSWLKSECGEDCFANTHEKKFLGRYPPDAEKCNHGSCSFEEAKAHCDELDDCKGVTKDVNNLYSVRQGKDGLRESAGPETTYLKADCEGGGCYAEAHQRKFLGKYPEKAEKCNHGSCSFADARSHCKELKECLGVTRDGNGAYSVRKGHEGLQDSGGEETSWLKSDCGDASGATDEAAAAASAAAGDAASDSAVFLEEALGDAEIAVIGYFGEGEGASLLRNVYSQFAVALKERMTERAADEHAAEVKAVAEAAAVAAAAGEAAAADGSAAGATAETAAAPEPIEPLVVPFIVADDARLFAELDDDVQEVGGDAVSPVQGVVFVKQFDGFSMTVPQSMLLDPQAMLDLFEDALAIQLPPQIHVFSERTQQQIFSNAIQQHLLLIMDDDNSATSTAARLALEQSARKRQSKLVHVSVASDQTGVLVGGLLS
jgi:hypothetical protein